MVAVVLALISCTARAAPEVIHFNCIPSAQVVDARQTRPSPRFTERVWLRQTTYCHGHCWPSSPQHLGQTIHSRHMGLCPEAIPLRSIEANHIASELVILESACQMKYSLTKGQISQPLQEVYKLLHIQNNSLPPTNK